MHGQTHCHHFGHCLRKYTAGSYIISGISGKGELSFTDIALGLRILNTPDMEV